MDAAGSVVQMVLSLAAVVAMILGLAWMTRRMQNLRGAQGGELRVRASLAVGIKERVVIVEAAGQQFLIGVAPGQVSLLQALDPALTSTGTSTDVVPAQVGIQGRPQADGIEGAGTHPGLGEAFAIQLNKLLGR